MLETLFWSYQTTVEEFEKLSEAVLDKLAADQTPSADLLASEEAARSAVLAARTLLLAELERQEGALRSTWPLNEAHRALPRARTRSH